MRERGGREFSKPLTANIFFQFVVDYSLFIERIDDYDQRLASILCQAFHDCSGCESVFKVHIQVYYSDIHALSTCTYMYEVHVQLPLTCMSNVTVTNTAHHINVYTQLSLIQLYKCLQALHFTFFCMINDMTTEFEYN